MRRSWLGILLLAAACQAPPAGLAPEPDASPPTPDAAPPDADVIVLGPSIVFDEVRVATSREDPHALSLLGQFLNPQLEQQVADGTLLLGIELRGLDDPSGQSDDELQVGMLSVTDDDGDVSDNFSPGQPETFSTEFPGDAPTFIFEDGAITGGRLMASGIPNLELLGQILPISIHNPEIEGVLAPNAARDQVIELYDGRLRGQLPAGLFALLPNIAEEMCPGSSLLDVIASGCGLVALQPDVDLDGDGLETFHDDDQDGSIDRCVDGDGTEIIGPTCYNDGRIADGYRLILAVHGVRAIVVR